MSQSWHDFVFGAFDPAGTVTVDKLPGALWVQALSLRVFGFHIWALVLPQVVEGVLTVLVLYRAVRRLAGPAAGLTAAAVLAVTPVTVLLSRGNISDSLLIPLLVLAAAYLLAAPAARLRTRCAHVALAGLVTAVISLSWMTAISLVPAQDRPYVDGSANDSLYTQVFDYNGLGRLTGNWATVAGPPSPIVIAAKENGQLLNAETFGIKASWHRLLAGPFAADSGWLVPAAVVGAAATVLGCAGYGAYLMSGTASGPALLTVVTLVVAAAAVAQLLLPASGRAGQLTAVAFAGAAALLLPAAASVSCVIGGLGPFDTPFESSKIAHDNQRLAAAGAALTAAVQRLELERPPGDALFGTDTSGLAQTYILYSGREVLPIGGYLGNVPAPTLAALQADISRGYVRTFVLPVSPQGPDPRVRWIESHCTEEPYPPNHSQVPYADFSCGTPAPVNQTAPAASQPSGAQG
jgi:4-amino-4-deoxy-L-arabinose transferase-like glycosyltransferase